METGWSKHQSPLPRGIGSLVLGPAIFLQPWRNRKDMSGKFCQVFAPSARILAEPMKLQQSCEYTQIAWPDASVHQNRESSYELWFLHVLCLWMVSFSTDLTQGVHMHVSISQEQDIYGIGNTPATTSPLTKNGHVLLIHYGNFSCCLTSSTTWSKLWQTPCIV